MRYWLKSFPGSIRLADLTPHEMILVMNLDSGLNKHHTKSPSGDGPVISRG